MGRSKKEQQSPVLYSQAEDVWSSSGMCICFISDLVCRAAGFVLLLQSESISVRTADAVLTQCHVQFPLNFQGK